MRYEWIERCIASWEQIRQLYADKDFSQANHLDKLLKMKAEYHHDMKEAQDIYDRSRGK